MDETTSGAARPSRRTIARGAAWSVPVVAVGAAAPAMAASGGTGSITASCIGTGPGVQYTVDITGSLSPSITVTFARSGVGTFSVSAPASWGTPTGSANIIQYSVPVVGGAVSGTAVVNYQLPNNGTATILGTIEAISGQVITGDTSATSTVARQGGGSSANYTCSAS